MTSTIAEQSSTSCQVYEKEILVEGRPTRLPCVNIDGELFTVFDGFPRIMTPEDEWEDRLRSPEHVIETSASHPEIKADIFSFWQEWPSSECRYPYPYDWEELAVVPTTSYDDWWNKKLKSRVRNKVRKCEKSGVVIRESEFDEEFASGVAAIFNESPIRQGRPFWHYGKSAETIRRQFSRYMWRERVAAAYVDDVMAGFIMVGNKGKFGYIGQILSKIEDRERGVNVALMAKAVEMCAEQGNEFLVYGFWGDSSLAEFKRRCGFEPARVPRYFVPLTRAGSLALKIQAHRGISGVLPAPVVRALKRVRASAYALRDR